MRPLQIALLCLLYFKWTYSYMSWPINVNIKINILKIVGDINRVGQAVDRASLTDHEPPAGNSSDHNTSTICFIVIGISIISATMISIDIILVVIIIPILITSSKGRSVRWDSLARSPIGSYWEAPLSSDVKGSVPQIGIIITF